MDRSAGRKQAKPVIRPALLSWSGVAARAIVVRDLPFLADQRRPAPEFRSLFPRFLIHQAIPGLGGLGPGRFRGFTCIGPGLS